MMKVGELRSQSIIILLSISPLCLFDICLIYLSASVLVHIYKYYILLLNDPFVII